jgi:hypothetical protein
MEKAQLLLGQMQPTSGIDSALAELVKASHSRGVEPEPYLAKVESPEMTY